MSTDSLLSNRNPSLLHPLLRKALWVMQPILQAEGYPFGIFEGFRSPERQAKLYARGRTSPGRIITRAKAWESYHQYGLAADMVALPEGKWSWSVPQAWWDRLHALGREHGLEALSFEQPHLQLANLKLSDLKKGVLPEGDAIWANNIRLAAESEAGLMPVAIALRIDPDLPPAA